jgi:hypothetical protein
MVSSRGHVGVSVEHMADSDQLCSHCNDRHLCVRLGSTMPGTPCVTCSSNDMLYFSPLTSCRGSRACVTPSLEPRDVRNSQITRPRAAATKHSSFASRRFLFASGRYPGILDLCDGIQRLRSCPRIGVHPAYAGMASAGSILWCASSFPFLVLLSSVLFLSSLDISLQRDALFSGPLRI